MPKKGFTLVEIAVVMMIIGFVTGGILVARSMIGSAKLGKITGELTQYDIAVKNFKLTFGTLPGDTNKLEPAGNNDGKINTWSHMYQAANQTWWQESFNFWYHLSTMREIEGKYSTYSGPALFNGNFAELAPKLNYGNECYLNAFTSGVEIPGDKVFGNTWTITGGINEGLGGCMTSKEAFELDSKIDDGVASSGNVQLMQPYSGPRITGVSGECTANAPGNPYDVEGMWINAFLNQPEPKPYDRVGCMLAVKAKW